MILIIIPLPHTPCSGNMHPHEVTIKTLNMQHVLMFVVFNNHFFDLLIVDRLPFLVSHYHFKHLHHIRPRKLTWFT